MVIKLGRFSTNPKVNQQQTTLDIDNTQTFPSLCCAALFSLCGHGSLSSGAGGVRMVSASRVLVSAAVTVLPRLWSLVSANQRPVSGSRDHCGPIRGRAAPSSLLIRPRHCTHHHHPSQPQWRILSDSLARGLCQSSKHSCKECFLSIFTFKDGITAIR